MAENVYGEDSILIMLVPGQIFQIQSSLLHFTLTQNINHPGNRADV